MKRSAYFIFAESVRGEVRDAIQKSADASSSDGAPASKISVAIVAKEIGVRWKALNDEEREIWKVKAAEENSAAAIHGEEDNGNDGTSGEDEDEKDQPGPSDSLLPLSLVKKIACSEPDNNTRISAEGLVAISKATDLLLGLLVQGSAKAASGQKRRTIQLKDYVSALKVDRRLAAIGLKDIEQLIKSKSEADASAKAAKAAEIKDRQTEESLKDKEGGENQDPNKAVVEVEDKAKGGGARKGRKPANQAEKSAKRAKAEEVASKGTKCIDTFFSKAPKQVEQHQDEEIGEVDEQI